MTSNEVFELDNSSVCDLVGKKFIISYKEFSNGKLEQMKRENKLIALDYSDSKSIEHYIFSDGFNHIKIASTDLVAMTKI